MSATNNQPTPIPWKSVEHDTLSLYTIIAPSQHSDGLSEIIGHIECEEDVNLICQAVNSHDALVEMLSDIVKSHDVSMGRRAKKLRVDIARDYLTALALSSGDEL